VVILRVAKKPRKQLKERRDRRRQTDDALASGDPTALATALNELLEAERQGSLRDPFEHTQLDSLRARLVRELAVATGRSESELHTVLSCDREPGPVAPA
jgi:RNA polymerase-interacting CarD/CdnL/TRCF family regulator